MDLPELMERLRLAERDAYAHDGVLVGHELLAAALDALDELAGADGQPDEAVKVAAEARQYLAEAEDAIQRARVALDAA